MLALALTLSAPAAAEDAEEEVYLTALAIDVAPQSGWYIERWSDWDFDAVDDAETTKVHFFSSSYQVPVSEAAARAWGESAIEELEALEHTEGQVTAARVAEFRGTEVGEATVSFSLRGKHPAELHLRSFPTQGRTAHLAAFAVKHRSARAKRALDTWSAALTFERGPEPLAGGGRVDAEEMGFGTTLPEGFRAPVKSELSEARNLAAETGQAYVSESCWLGISPEASGDAAVLVSCQAGKWIGVLDEHSFEGVEAELHEAFFSGVEVPKGVGYPHADRLSIIWHPPSRGDKALRMALTPYDRGVALTYAMGAAEDAARLDVALRSALDEMSFSGPDGGAHPTGAAAWISYAARYRPIFLVAGVVPVVLVFGFIALKIKNAGPSWQEV